MEEFRGKTLTELLKLKGENRKLIIHRADVGCRYCVSDTGTVGVRVYKSCWKTYTHTL
jgi:hypothetical protein